MAGELAFFELGVGDAERGRAFYESLFGWRFESGPSGKGFVITTPNLPGGMHGGDAGAAPYVFFAVDDIDAAVARVRDLGGEVEEVDVEGDEESTARFGRFKLCRDDQGSSFGFISGRAAAERPRTSAGRVRPCQRAKEAGRSRPMAEPRRRPARPTGGP